MAQRIMCPSLGVLRRSISVDVFTASKPSTRALSSSARQLEEKPSDAASSTPGMSHTHSIALQRHYLTSRQLQLPQQTPTHAAPAPKPPSAKSPTSKTAASNPAASHEAISPVAKWCVVPPQVHPPTAKQAIRALPIHAWHASPAHPPHRALFLQEEAKWCAPHPHSEYPATPP